MNPLINYSAEQLEARSVDVLRAYDPELLLKPKTLDVYAVIEKILDVPYDWKYLTPNQSVLGATAFNSGYMYVWPEPIYRDGMLPYRLSVERGTILIDSTLTERNNRGRENFTVIHEVFHQILHEQYFSNMPPDYAHYSKNNQYENNGHKKLVTDLDFIEYQANFSAACFLMPRDLIDITFRKRFSREVYSKWKSIYIDNLVRDMAPEFNVSETSLKYRLEHLNILKKKDDKNHYLLVD